MLAVSFGISAVVAILQRADAVLSGLPGYRVCLNPNQSRYDAINLGLNLVSAGQLIAWGALALYLLWRSGIRPSAIGLGRVQWRRDIFGGLGLAAPQFFFVAAGLQQGAPPARAGIALASAIGVDHHGVEFGHSSDATRPDPTVVTAATREERAPRHPGWIRRMPCTRLVASSR